MIYLRNAKGQALIESVLFIPIIALIIFSIAWFSRVLITKQQLVSASRYGTDLILYTSLNENEVKEEIKNYLSHRWIKGRKLNRDKLTNENINVKIDKFYLPKTSDPSSLLSDIGKCMDQLVRPWEHTSYVEIRYPFNIPRVFTLVMPEESYNNFYVSARSEVLAGTGAEKH